jgi:hypothetical protein
MDLANVVEDSREGEAIEIDILEPEAGAEIHREVGHAVHVAVEIFDHVFHDLDQDVLRNLSHLTHLWISLTP